MNNEHIIVITEARQELENLHAGEITLAGRIDYFLKSIKENKIFATSYIEQLLDELLWAFEDRNYEESNIYKLVEKTRGY